MTRISLQDVIAKWLAIVKGNARRFSLVNEERYFAPGFPQGIYLVVKCVHSLVQYSLLKKTNTQSREIPKRQWLTGRALLVSKKRLNIEEL